MASLKQSQIYGALRIYNTVDENTTFENTISIDPEENDGKLTFSNSIILPGLSFSGNTGTINDVYSITFADITNSSISNLYKLNMNNAGVLYFGNNRISIGTFGESLHYFKILSHGSAGGIYLGNYAGETESGVKLKWSNSVLNIDRPVTIDNGLSLNKTSISNLGTLSFSNSNSTAILLWNGATLNINQPLTTKSITIQSGIGYSTTLSASNNDNTLHLNGGITINPSVTGEDTNQTIITNSSIETLSLSSQLIKTGTSNILISGTDDASTNATFGVAIGDNITTFRGVGAVAIGPETKAIAGAISIGRSSNATGQNSIAIGARNTSSKVATTADGTGSIAIGAQSSINGVGMNGAQAHGEASIAIGVNSQTNSNYNIAIGMGANVGNAAEGGIALGAGASCSTTNALELPSEYKVYADGVITTSDKQDKTDIKNLTNNYTPFLMDLEPVTYRFNYRNNYTVENPDPKFRNKYGISEYDKIEHAKATKANSRTHVGFIAQDVKSTIEKHFPNNDHLDIINIAKIDTGEFQKGEIEPGYERYYMNYSAMIPVLVKVLQEQQEEINNLKSEIEKLKK